MLRLQHWLIVLPSALAIIAVLFFLPKSKKTTELHNHTLVDENHFSIAVLEKQLFDRLSADNQNTLSVLYADTSSSPKVYKSLSAFCTNEKLKINPILSIYYDYCYTLATVETPNGLARKARFLHILALETKDKHIHNRLLDWSLSLLTKANQLSRIPNDSILVDIAVAQLWYLPEEGRAVAPPMQAIAKLKTIAEKNPKQTYALYMLGMASLVSNQSEKAIQYFEKTLTGNPKDKTVLKILSDLHTELGNQTKAQQYQKALNELDAEK